MTQGPFVIDINSLEFLETPQRFLAPMLETGNMHYVESLPIPGYVIVRHAAVLDAMVDPRLSRSPRFWEHYHDDGSDTYPTLSWMRQQSPLGNNETHDVHRRLFQKAFKPSTIRRMEEQIIQVVNKYTGVFEQDEADVVTAFESTTLETISTILGLPEGELDGGFLQQAQAWLRSIDPLISPEEKKLAEEGAAYLTQKVRQLVRLYMNQPADNLISDLVAGIRQDADLDEDHVVLSVLSLFAAGSHTTAQASAMMLKTFAAHPGQLQLLRDQRALMDNAINECLRFENVGKFMVRFACDDFSLDSITVPKGKMLMLSLTAANRDPSVFPDPDKFDITRENLGQAATFGHGMYYCTGAHIARMVLRAELQALLDKTQGAITQKQAAKWRDNDIVFRSLTSLPMQFNHHPAGD